MKKTHLIGIIGIIAGIFIIVTASKDVSTFSTFAEAKASQKEVKISGELDLDKEISYNPDVDPNSFVFHLIDKSGVSNKVILKSPKPQDFERAENVVATGIMDGNTFVSTEILMKCPSKYKDEETRIRAQI